MPNPEKIEEVKQLVELLGSHNVQFITDHTGLTVAEVSDLRHQLKKNGAQMRVAKNRLIKLARADAGLLSIDDILEGPSSMVFAVDDPVSPAKTIKEFIDDIDRPKVKAIIIDNELFDLSKFDEIAAMPSIDELRAKAVCAIASPITGLVFVMSGLLRGFAIALNAIAEQKKN